MTSIVSFSLYVKLCFFLQNCMSVVQLAISKLPADHLNKPLLFFIIHFGTIYQFWINLTDSYVIWFSLTLAIHVSSFVLKSVGRDTRHHTISWTLKSGCQGISVPWSPVQHLNYTWYKHNILKQKQKYTERMVFQSLLNKSSSNHERKKKKIAHWRKLLRW